MNERIETLDNYAGHDTSRVNPFWKRGDFGPVVLFQGRSLTFVSFGPIVGLGAFLGLIHIWFYLGSYQIIAHASSANQLALKLAFGAPLSAYVITRLLDINTWISGEKSFSEYIRTVSFGLWGGLFGGLFILSSFAFVTQTPLLSLLDAFAVGVPLAQVLGRLGCLNYGCCHGTECSSHHQPGIRYFNTQTKVLRYEPKLRGKRLHPTQIYSALANLAIYVIILGIWLTWESRPSGTLAATYMALYGLKRFSIEFLRGEYPRVYFSGLTLWQWFSLFFVALGFGALLYIVTSGQGVGNGDFAAGLYSIQSALGILIATSLILGLVYGSHGKKIGSW